ncbi:mitochondrial genome maintenance exonuclease 1 [Python bivittatus]|uniref:Mitochondrial genome maintenance exonuclease 1 n=1 Tax=Python bivittatus TaxID=176946 RepID=A0A9F2QZC4_PYTBI|nr:mitochondrial genome maintenance exonuclease 1 [Python bivittatus]XP_007431464.1 mitochondrial genome maintenance exonuclease 1 [Python bivittatus]XP_025024426.1 mitochondrial genome maintenance exonuclease 1 [Python bivittatus]
MGSFHLLFRKSRRLPVLTTLLSEKKLSHRSLTISSPFYKKKRTEYENIDPQKYGNLIHYLTSGKDRSDRSKPFEEDNAGCQYKLPANETETKLPENWIPLMNPRKSSLHQKVDQGLPLQIHLQKNAWASVTSVLQQTMPVEQAFYLEKWKQQMILKLGKEGFEEYMKNTFQTGKSFHAAMEALLLTKENFVKAQKEDTSISSYIISVKHVLQDITGVRALESAVQHEALHYQGLVDCIAEYRGRLCIIDWKTSGKSKPFLQNTYDNPLQIAAYIGAINHDSNYDFQVNCGLLVVAYKDGSPAHSHFMDSELCSQYWNKWLHRLEEFEEKGKNSTV